MLRRPSADYFLLIVARRIIDENDCIRAQPIDQKRQGRIPRQRIIDAYRVFMQEHREIAGLVAEDLAAWQYWGAVPDYVALMKSGVRQQYASRAAIVAYLRQSPAGAAGVDDK